MEDSIYAVFRSTDNIIYKQFLLSDEASEYNNIFANITTTSLTTISTGLREYVDINLTEYPDIVNRILIVLDNYLPDICLARYCRFYSHKYGHIKPHVDMNHDNKSNYTLLIYLTDDFEGGELSIKVKRTADDLELTEPNKFHHVFTFKPFKGYGILFRKNLSRWADYVIGNKNLLLHLFSPY